MTNRQPIEKKQGATPGNTISVHSIFQTIQGEGPFTGQRAVFVRLAGCNLQCPSCDTDYTSFRRDMTDEEIVANVDLLEKESKSLQEPPLVVLTGGEPFRQVIRPLVLRLVLTGYRVQIETNGTLYQDLPFASRQLTIVCSPKAGQITPELVRHIAALKYVVEDGFVGADGLPTCVLGRVPGENSVVARPPKGFRGPVYVQPMDAHDTEKNKANTRAAIESVMRFGYTLCVQAHKIIGVE